MKNVSSLCLPVLKIDLVKYQEPYVEASCQKSLALVSWTCSITMLERPQPSAGAGQH